MKFCRLFDHFIGARPQRQRYGKDERFGSLEIDDQCELGRRLHGKVGRLLILEGEGVVLLEKGVGMHPA
jgi:hypothetical protein